MKTTQRSIGSTSTYLLIGSSKMSYYATGTCVFVCCEDENRTRNLLVMSQACYHYTTSHVRGKNLNAQLPLAPVLYLLCKVIAFFLNYEIFRANRS